MVEYTIKELKHFDPYRFLYINLLTYPYRYLYYTDLLNILQLIMYFSAGYLDRKIYIHITAETMKSLTNCK